MVPFSPLFYGIRDATPASRYLYLSFRFTFSPLFYGIRDATLKSATRLTAGFALSVPYFTGFVMLQGNGISSLSFMSSFSPLFYGIRDATEGCAFDPTGTYLFQSPILRDS